MMHDARSKTKKFMVVNRDLITIKSSNKKVTQYNFIVLYADFQHYSITISNWS